MNFVKMVGMAHFHVAPDSSRSAGAVGFQLQVHVSPPSTAEGKLVLTL